MGSKNYIPKTCTCGSGQPAKPQYHKDFFICYACVMCEPERMSLFRERDTSDPYSIENELQ